MERIVLFYLFLHIVPAYLSCSGPDTTGPCSVTCGGGLQTVKKCSCYEYYEPHNTNTYGPCPGPYPVACYGKKKRSTRCNDYITTEKCNEICLYGNSFVNKGCSCSSWRSGTCCENCKHIDIAHCETGYKECGGSPDGIRCTKCTRPYYSAGFGKGCQECTQIANCMTRHCSNNVDQVCDQCVDDKVFYQRWNSDRTCERMCSFDAHTCWPGTCSNELTSGCQCATGFQKKSDSFKTSCQLESNNKPSINTCQTRIDGTNGEAKQTTAGNCSSLSDFYGNFQPTYLTFDMQADFLVDISRVPRPSATRPYIQEEHFGITDASVLTNKISVGGQVSRLETVSLKNDLNNSTNATATFAAKMNYTLSKSSSSLQNGDRLCVIFEALGGGYVKTNDFRTNSVQNPVPYDKTTGQETICYRYDDAKPRHCLLEKTCSIHITEPVQVANRITRSSDKLVSFYGWKDPIPVGGTAEHASGITSFQVTVHEVFDGIVDLKKVFDKKMNASETSLTLNLTSAGPRLYCILLEVKDAADNVQQARRFILYDKTTTITSRHDKRFTVTSASHVTSFKWQTHHNDICLDWKEYFYNDFYSKNDLLGKINPDPNGLIKDMYEQETGQIPVSGTPNVDGIVQFLFSWSLTNGALSPKENVPNFLNQSFCKRLNLSDGETYTLNIEAVDIVNNTYSENRTVHIDRTVPHINNIGLVKNGIKQLFVHDETDLSNMDLNFEALDPHSGILNMEWKFGISDSGQELGSGFLAASTIQQTSCPVHESCCYCPDVGKCERYNYSIPLNKLVDNNTNIGNHNRNYYFTIKVTNNAKLSNIEHLDVLVDDSPPEAGVVYEGAVGGNDIDYTSASDFMVRWHGFIDHESGIREYRLGLADSCLNKKQLFHNVDGNISEYSIIPYTETSVRLQANFTGKKYVNIIAINNAMESSKIVCSDGITRDVSPPSIKDLKLQNGRWTESLFCSDGKAWLFNANMKKVLLPQEEDCKELCKVDSTEKALFDVLPTEYTLKNDTAVAQFLCNRVFLYDKNTIIYLPHDHIVLSWNTDETGSQIEDTLVGFGTTSGNSSDLSDVNFMSTNKTTTFKKIHVGQGTGNLFFAYIKTVSKAGLEHIANVGPLLIDETPPYHKEIPKVYIDNTSLVVGWSNDTFYDVEQATPINQIFFQIAHAQQVISPLMEWRDEDAVKCVNYSGGCFKYPLGKLQRADTDLGLNFSVKIYAYNNAGHFTELETESFRIPSRYPPGQAIVRDIDPIMKDVPIPKDVDVHFTTNTLCVQWDGFKHHENIKVEIGVGTLNDTDNIVPFQSTLETEMACLNSTGLQQNVKYYIVLKASCSGGVTLSSSNGVIIIDAPNYASLLEVDVEQLDKTTYSFARTMINDTSVKLCSISSLTIGYSYQIILQQQASHIVSDEVFYNATDGWRTSFELVPLIEHPCIVINTNESDNSSVKVVRVYDDILSTNTESITVSIRHPNDSVGNIFYRVALLGSPISANLTVSHFSQITDYEGIYDRDEHMLSKIKLSSDMQYAVELSICNNVHCAESVYSRVYETEEYIMTGNIETSDIEVNGEKACVDVDLGWRRFIAKSGILLYQWTITKDAEAHSILTTWKSIKATEDLTSHVRKCVDLPVLGHSTMFLCVRAFSRAGNTVTTCKQASTLVVTDIRIDTVYDIDTSSESWKVIQNMVHSSNVGAKYSVIHDAELDFGTVNSTVAGVIMYATERNVTWFLMSSSRLPYFDHCDRDNDCTYSVTTDTGFAQIKRELIKLNTVYYICAYSNTTLVTRELYTETLDEIRSCSNGFIIDSSPPSSGLVKVQNNAGFLTNLANFKITWTGFDDNTEAEQLGYVSRIKHYAYSIGTRPGGEDVSNFTIIGDTVQAVHPYLNAYDGTEIYVTVRATDLSGLTTVATSDPLIVDTSPPSQGTIVIDTNSLPFITSESIDLVLKGFQDQESGIDHFTVEIGSSQGSDDIKQQTIYHSDRITVELPNTLQDGYRYVIRVKAVNRAGLSSIPQSLAFTWDKSPPSGGHVLDGHWSNLKNVDFQTDLGYIQGHWKGFSDPHSGIRYYRVALGTKPFNDDVEAMVDVGLHSDILWNGTFHTGQKYFITVAACNGAGLCLMSSSDGITLDNSPPIHGVVRVGSSNGHHKFLPYRSSLHIQWVGFDDPQSGIDHYETCLGYQPNICDILPYSSSLLESSIIKTNLNLPAGRNLYACVKAVNRVGMAVVTCSDTFQVDDTPPLIVQRPVFVLDYNAFSGKAIQWDRSVLRLCWKFVDNESKIVSHMVALKTHYDGHTPLENMHVADIDNLTVSFDEKNWLRDGDEYYVVVTSCNVAGLCSSAMSDNLTIDSTPPHLGGFKPPLEWKNFVDSSNKTKSNVTLTWYGFIDAESSVDSYYLTVSRNFSGFELSNGIVKIKAYNNTAENRAVITLSGSVHEDDTLILSIWATNGAGLNTSVARISVDALMSSKTRSFENAAGTLEIQKHSCDIHFCNKDCTCAILGQQCKSNIKCSQHTTNPASSGLPLVHVYGGLPDNINHISASSACLAGHWVTDGDEALVERYEWSMGLTGQPVGDGIFGKETPWKDVGKRKHAVYCKPSFESGLRHNTNYSVYVKAWYSFDSFAEFVSEPILIDHSPPQLSKGKTIKDSDPSCIMDYDFIDWMDTITACWDGVFLESQGKIIHYSISLGTTINGSDVYSRTNVGLTTNITLTSMSLSHGTRYYFTVTAYNDVGMHSFISSDGFVIDMDRPVAGVVFNTDMHTDTLYQASNTSFSTSWHGFVDQFSGIKTYYVAVIESSATDYTNVTYTNVNLQTMHTFKNLKLEHGRSYVALVKAVDAAGHESEVVRSSPKAIDVTPPSPFECLHYDNINSTYNGQFADVSFTVNLTKNVLYVLRGIITGSEVEDVNPILTIGRYKLHLPVAVNHNGTVEFEYALLSHVSGLSTINISTHEQWRSMSNYSANIKVDMSQCTLRRPVNDQTKALIVQQVGASRLGISCFVSDEESALYKVHIGAGTTPGGFQIKTLSDVRGRTSNIIDANVEHGSKVYVSAIAYNHAGLRSILHAPPVIIDKTPPVVRIIATEITWADSRSNDAEVRTTLTSRLIVTDGESGIKYCICSLGRTQGSADVMSSAVSDTIESCLFENLTLHHGNRLYTTVKCINNAELAAETTSDMITVSTEHPDIAKAALRVIPSDKRDIANSNLVQTAPYVLTDGSHVQLEWSGFYDVSGIDHYEYRLMSDNQSLTDWTSAGKHTSADIKGVNLAFGKFFTADVRAVNLGMYKSYPVSAGVVLFNKEPALTGKPVSMSRREENVIEIDWGGVFRLTDGIQAYFDVLVGTRLGYADVIELQKIYVTRHIINVPRSTIITPNVSELFIAITCTYNTGLYTIYRTSYII